MSRITANDVNIALVRLNKTVDRVQGKHHYTVHKEYDSWVLEARNIKTGTVNGVIRGIGTREMYNNIQTSIKVLIDSIEE